MLISMTPKLSHNSPCINKLDRLVWTGGTAFTSYGTRIGVRFNDNSLLERLPNYLPPRWRATERTEVATMYSLIAGDYVPQGRLRRYHLLYQDSTRLARSTDMDEVLEALESSLHMTVAVGNREKLFLHAGVVGWNGKAILIPGRTMSGKTSLVRALVEAGATYYSDEYAILDDQSRVYPYPKLLSIRQADSERPQRCPVERFGGTAGTRPLPIGALLFTQYREDAKWRPTSLSPAQAMLALLDHAVLLRMRPERALATLLPFVTDVPIFQGKRGDASETAQALLTRLSRSELFQADRAA